MSGRHLLVTNDFPPKLGGIQQYLWELWRRLDPATFRVMTTPHRGADVFDAQQNYEIVRSREPFLLPYPWLGRRLDQAANDFGAALHVIDPAVPLGIIGPTLSKPYVVVLHGAEVTVPGRLPGSRQALARVLENATGVISAGEYALGEAERAVGRTLANAVIPPGVDVDKFAPATKPAQRAVREKYNIAPDAPLILSVSRLVPRKGMDTLIAVASRLHRTHPDLVVCIAGAGRDSRRLQRRIDALRAPVRLLGRIDDDDKAALYGAADVFSMLCRNRWAGLEQEGFGIVFVEAAAAGTPQIAGRSGGADEAVEDQVTGLVVDGDATIEDIAATFRSLLDDPERRARMSEASRARAVSDFSYDVLAQSLETTLQGWCT
ncbi:MAG: glycosyltransferase family 4 protein [Acidimicrobiia bacterium]|nr:glycosyltransferase family 4 protein [Acidimicrobiia bacterium]